VNAWYQARDVCDEATWTCVVTPTVTLEDGRHTWYVKGWNPAGHGPWSDMPFWVSSETGGQDAPTSGEGPLYLPLVLKPGGEAEAEPAPAPVETPVPAQPDVDLDQDPPIGDGPSLPPPEIDQQTEPPLEEEMLPEGPGR
jgi:hypothetical protein